MIVSWDTRPGVPVCDSQGRSDKLPQTQFSHSHRGDPSEIRVLAGPAALCTQGRAPRPPPLWLSLAPRSPWLVAAPSSLCVSPFPYGHPPLGEGPLTQLNPGLTQ